MSLRRRRRKREGTADEAAPPAEPTGSAGDEGSGGGLISETRAALAPVRKRHMLVAGLSLLGFVFAGTLLFSAVSLGTSQPSFCGRCHVMEPYIAAWEQSAHADVNCESCHLTPGFFGFIGGKIAGLQVVANYIRGDYEDWSFNAAVSNASCLQCHDEILAKNIHSADTGVIVSHRNIVGRQQVHVLPLVCLTRTAVQMGCTRRCPRVSRVATTRSRRSTATCATSASAASRGWPLRPEPG
jgi:hypothetical protein